MLWLGSTAAEREGVFYHISQSDHPAIGLNQDPKRLSTGNQHILSLSRIQVAREISMQEEGAPLLVQSSISFFLFEIFISFLCRTLYTKEMRMIAHV